MKSTVMYWPGKIGDALLQWPVAYQWSKKEGKKFEAWIDKSCHPLMPLFQAQECVESVRVVDHSKNYSCGGQPWQGEFTSEEQVEHEIYSLGMRQFPTRQITLQTLEWLPFDLDKDALAKEPSLKVQPLSGEVSRCVLHGTFKTHMGSTPSFWRFLNHRKEELEERFREMVFVGIPDELERAQELYPEWTTFNDSGSFLELARLVAGAEMVIGVGSSVVALAGALKVPSLRVHDPIGDAPRVIWSCLGEQQWNETERDLRIKWPEILESVGKGPQGDRAGEPEVPTLQKEMSRDTLQEQETA